jgi:hypothetical protein
VVKIVAIAFSDPVLFEQNMARRADSVRRQTIFDPRQGAAVQRPYRTAGLGDAQQMAHIAAHPCDTGHFGDLAPTQFNGQVIRHLRCAGTTGARIH